MTFIKELKSRGHSPRSGQRPGKAQLTPACAKSVRAPRVLQFKRESRVPLHTGRGLHGLNFEESPERTEQWACRVLAGAEEPGGPEMPGSQGGCTQGARHPGGGYRLIQELVSVTTSQALSLMSPGR